MFEQLEQLPPDPILGLMGIYQQDDNPNKIDLGVGVYKNESGNTPVMAAVRLAEEQLISVQETKAYVGPAGDAGFNECIQKLIFGNAQESSLNQRIATIQTTGGCGALRIAAEFIKRCRPDTRIWASDPTWANHVPLLGDAGLEICEYPYYDHESHQIRFADMMNCLEQVQQGDIVLLHGCCHNPCGADLTDDQWRIIAEITLRRGFIPFVDLAYQGLGRGLNEDAFGLRYLASQVPEMLVASSCSKNFGLYRERTGSISLLVEQPRALSAAVSQLVSVIRGIYSMPPHHGASIVTEILTNPQLTESWELELTGMRDRINHLRQLLVEKLNERQTVEDFSFIAKEQGMFSFLGLNAEQISRLRDQHSVYMVDSSRINVAGISQHNIDYLADSICTVL